MSLTPQDIDRIANLARLELQPEESERMLTNINGFFGIVEAMQAVDTSGVQPLAHPVAAIQDIALRLRELAPSANPASTLSPWATAASMRPWGRTQNDCSGIKGPRRCTTIQVTAMQLSRSTASAPP